MFSNVNQNFKLIILNLFNSVWNLLILWNYTVVFFSPQEVMEMTSTFKQQKFHLVQSGFNPSTISDPLYVLDYQQKSYNPLTHSIHQSILTGERKL